MIVFVPVVSIELCHFVSSKTIYTIVPNYIFFEILIYQYMLYVTLFTLKLPERLMVVLRDGRTLIGYLRSIDQFGKCGKLAMFS